MPTPPDPDTAAALFLHVRTVVGVILGLSIGKLLTGAATLAEHPRKIRVWWVHLGWLFYALISVIGYWWWEFHLRDVQVWTFGLYLFTFTYAACYYMMCSLLFPEDMTDYTSYENYFISRRRWFFAVLGLTYLLDVGDTLLKGTEYLGALGTPYVVRTILSILGCGIGALFANRNIQAGLVVVAIIFQLWFFFTFYDRLS